MEEGRGNTGSRKGVGGSQPRDFPGLWHSDCPGGGGGGVAPREWQGFPSLQVLAHRGRLALGTEPVSSSGTEVRWRGTARGAHRSPHPKTPHPNPPWAEPCKSFWKRPAVGG